MEVKASRRAGALEHWIAARESLAAAAQVVIDELAPLLTADERTRFLDAEGLHRPLAALADAVAVVAPFRGRGVAAQSRMGHPPARPSTSSIASTSSAPA